MRTIKHVSEEKDDIEKGDRSKLSDTKLNGDGRLTLMPLVVGGTVTLERSFPV